MELIRNLDSPAPSIQGGAVTIGNFDGVHRGHAKLIGQLRRLAAAVDGPSVVFTFEPHPVRLLRPSETPPPLTWTERKADLLEEIGVDVLIAYPTSEQLLRLGYRQFFEQIIMDRLAARAMVEGPNFFFGRGRQGNVKSLGELCEENHVQLEIAEPIETGGELISSSRIRTLIGSGDVQIASDLLTRPYRIRGLVIHGQGRGGKIGFPTANLDAVDTLVPAPGVYAGKGYHDGQVSLAAINIGPNPTFGEHATKIEVHLLDVDKTLYGDVLEVDFYERLRDIQHFESVEQLKLQLDQDMARVRQLVGSGDNASG